MGCNSCYSNTCQSAPDRKCEQRLTLSHVPGTCATLAATFDGITSTLDLTTMIKCAETDTRFQWNEDKCRMEFLSEKYLSSNGTQGFIQSITAKTIAGCINLCDLADVSVKACEPNHCDLLVWREPDTACPDPGDEAQWEPYTIPTGDIAEVVGVSEDGCLVKGDLLCLLCDKMEEADSSQPYSTVVCQDGCLKKDPCPYFKTIENVTDFKTESAGTGGVYDGVGVVNPSGNGNEVEMFCTRTITNDTACCQLVTVHAEFGGCVVGATFPLEVTIYAYFTSTGGTIVGGDPTTPNRKDTTIAHPPEVDGAPTGSGFVSAYGDAQIQVKLCPGESTTIGSGIGYHTYSGTVAKMINIIGNDDADFGGNAQGEGVLEPSLTVEKIDNCDC